VKKVCGPKIAMMKNPRVQPRNSCDGTITAIFSIKAIQVNLCCLPHISLGFGAKFT